MVFGEMIWSQSHHAQAEDRIHRVNQSEPCNIYYAMFANSLDGIVYGRIQQTKRATAAVVDGPPRVTPAKRPPTARVTEPLPAVPSVASAAPAVPSVASTAPEAPPVTPAKKRRTD